MPSNDLRKVGVNKPFPGRITSMARIPHTAGLLVFVTQIVSCASAPANHSQPQSPSQSQSETQSRLIVAKIAGQPIYDDEMVSFAESELNDLRRQEYTIKLKALNRAIDEKLLTLEAQKKKVDVDALLKAEADSKVADPTDGEIQAYYETQKDALKVPLGQIRPQILQLLKQARINQARELYKAALRQQASIDILLAAPRVDVVVDPLRVKGNPQASVTIVEFSDFECPFCRKAEPTVVRLIQEYGDKIRFAYRDVPLNNHPRAQPAAEASRCAAEQQQFWPYHDLLFKEPMRLTDADLTEYAQTLKLDMAKFKSCLEGAKFRQQVQSDFQDAIRVGVTGTPTFFINGAPTTGAPPYEQFKQTIERELELAKKKSGKGA
jgi:protein-disulfide isomerase